MDKGQQLIVYGFQPDDDPGHFHAAACASGAGPHKHQADEDGLGKLGPHIKIHRRKSRSCDDGSNLEGRVVEGLENASKRSPDIYGDKGYRRRDDPQIHPGFLAGKGILKPSHRKQIIHIKIHSEKDHKNRHNPLQVVTVIICDAGVLDAEPAGAGSAEAGGKGVKQRHTAQKQKHHLDQGHDQIDHVQDLCCGLDLGRQFTHRRPRALRPHDVHGVAASGQRQA